MRRIPSLLALLILVLSLGLLAGCSGGGATDNPAPSGDGKSAEGGPKLRVGISVPAADHGWTAGVIYWAKEAQKEYPDVEFTLATADKPETQINDLETMIVKKLDAIVVLATESAPITPVAKKIREAGILLVNVDRGFLEPVADVFLEGDNKQFGRKSAEYMVEKLGGKGNILVLEGIPCTVNTDRVNAAKEVFAKSPGIKILDSQTGMWNREKAYNVMQALLLKHKKVDAVWAQDDDMALGAEQAIKEAGRDKEMWMLGGAGMKDIVKRVMEKDPMFPADITYPPSMIKQGIKTAVDMLKAGKRRNETQEHVTINIDLITPENAKDFYFPDSVY
ncbi:MAG: ABC transporter substrate-binding protein [Armatimonadetes bacterium]|nr:ABC transporter substrate-binding protein [Armatimonadota bacterium]